jgi:mannose-6-phosphate isomerase-like protein (cupin superfamily)
MKGYVQNIQKIVNDNEDFRHVVYTSNHSQLVLMNLQPGEEIGLEVHDENDQYFRFESGEGRVVIDDNEYAVAAGFVALVPAGSQHNIINTSQSDTLRLLTMYMPPHHKDGIVRASKHEAEENEEDFDGVTTETE